MSKHFYIISNQSRHDTFRLSIVVHFATNLVGLPINIKGKYYTAFAQRDQRQKMT